jgi:hypothetical protein
MPGEVNPTQQEAMVMVCIQVIGEDTSLPGSFSPERISAARDVAIGLVLVGAGMAQPWQTATFTAMAANFVPLVAPANQMSYDTQQFYNARWRSS